MHRQRMHSSSITSAGYDPARHLLELEFEGGSIYRYADVPQRAWRALQDAASKGQFVNWQIKSKFPYKKLR